MSENLLKNIPLFASLEDDSLAELSTLLEKHTYTPHHTIFWTNERGDHLYVIQKGRVQISYTDEKGQEIILAVLKPGAFFGDLSLIDGGLHSATARTLTETTVLTLDRTSFYQFLNKYPKLSSALMVTLSQRLRDSNYRVSGLSNANEQLNAERSRFQHFIDNIASILTSGAFIAFYVLFIVGWVAAQVYFYKRMYHQPISFLDTPPTFYVLGFLITLTSFLLTILILNSQKRQAELDRIRGDIEYQVNVKSQTEIMKLHLKMDRLADLMNQNKSESATADQEEESDQ